MKSHFDMFLLAFASIQLILLTMTTRAMPPRLMSDTGDQKSTLTLVNSQQNQVLKVFGLDQESEKDGAPELLLATVEGNARKVASLIDSGVDVNARNQQGQTALMGAAAQCNWDIFEMLLENGADASLIDERSGRSVLFYVAFCHELSIQALQPVLEDADMEIRDDEGQTPLIWAARLGNAEWVQNLLDYGAAVNARDTSGEAALHNALENDAAKAYKIVQILVQAKADLEIQDERYGGRTAFMKAVDMGGDYFEIAQLLLDSGANIDAYDKSGRTTLMRLARYSRNVAQVKWLIDHHADVNKRNKEGNTALHMAILGSPEMVQVLLEAGADPDAKDKEGGNAPIVVATLNKNIEALKILLAFGANPNVKGNVRMSLLRYAIYSEKIEFVRALLDANPDPNLSDGSGSTPLQTAIDTKNAELVEMLLAAGADVNARTSLYKNHLKHAKRRHAGSEIIEMIEKAIRDQSRFISFLKKIKLVR